MGWYFTPEAFRLCFLNQVRTGHRPVRAWFLKIVPVQMSVCVCVFVCPPPRLLITSGVIWHDMDSIRLVKQALYSCCMVTVLIVVNGHGLFIGTHCRH